MTYWAGYGQDLPEIAAEVTAKGALFVIAYPMPEGDPASTGCRFDYVELRPGPVRVVEIWNGGAWPGYSKAGMSLCRDGLGQGHCLVATAGTDIHGPKGGVGRIGFNNVWSETLTESAVLTAVRAARNFLPTGPQPNLTTQVPGGDPVVMGSELPDRAEVCADWTTENVPSSLRFHDASGAVSRHDLGEQSSGRVVRDSVPAGLVMAELRDRTGSPRVATNPLFASEL